MQIEAILLLIFVITIILFFIYKPIVVKDFDNKLSNIAINKQKLSILKFDLENGLLDENSFIIAKDELANNLAQEINVNEQTTKPINNHFVAIIVAVFILTLSAIFTSYLMSDSNITKVDSIEKIKAHLQENPKDAKAWQMLAISLSLENKLLEAKNAYEKSYSLGNIEADFLAEYASILAIIRDGDFSGKPAYLIKKALEIDQNSVKALYLSGIVAANINKFNLAEIIWKKALSLSKKNSADYKLLQSVLARLDYLLNTNSKQISVIIDIDENLLKSRADDYLMIYAKNSNGSRMPIAIEKIKLSEFKGMIILNDDNSVMPTLKLSQADKVIIVARISKSGSAIRNESDIEAKSEVIKVDNQTITIKIK